MELDSLSDAELERWREHPVTRIASQALRASIQMQRDSATASYWAGQPWPEADRKALLRLEAAWEDLFEASADDFKAMMRMQNEQRDNPG